MDNKWIKDTFEEYKQVDAFNSSGVKHLLRSPAHYKALKDKPLESVAADFGTLVHTCLLEPHRIGDIVVEPEGDKRSSKFREELAQWKQSLNNCAIIASQKDKDEALLILDRVQNHSIASAFLSGGHHERSGYIHDPAFDIRIKFRPDIKKDNCIIDIKTAKNAQYDSFQRDIFNFGYDIQAAFYKFYGTNLARLTGEELVDNFVWLVIEKEPPYGIAIYIADSSVIRAGSAKCIKAIEKYQACYQSDIWHSYEEMPVIMNAPAWIKE